MSEKRKQQKQSRRTHPRPTRDFDILLRAKDTLDRDGVLNWDERVPVSEWEGVVSDPYAKVLRVIGLNLSWHRTSGRIPAELARLSELQLLELTGNLLTGIIPPALGRLGRLKVLRLSGNHLTGAIPPP